MKTPCMYCYEREQLNEKGIYGCHSFCKQYQKFNDKRTEIKKRKYLENEQESVRIDRFIKISKLKPEKFKGLRGREI